MVLQSSLDLKKAFWRLDARLFDRKYTPFSTSRGNLKYHKLPQGLTYASSSFQKLINRVMHGQIVFVFAMLIIFLSLVRNEEHHKIHLHKIANRLNAHSLKLNMKNT